MRRFFRWLVTTLTWRNRVSQGWLLEQDRREDTRGIDAVRWQSKYVDPLSWQGTKRKGA